VDDALRTEAEVQPAVDATKPSPFATECDLVMKGGITSGVVYPLAIVEIANAFRLRSIAGTSAGAIAAAAAAAAELGRQRYKARELKDDPDGFGHLADLPTLLGSTAADGRSTRLLAFFRPRKSLDGVFKALLAAIGIKSIAKRVLSLLTALVRNQWFAAAVGLAVGLIPLFFVQWTPFPWMVLVWVGAFAIVLAIAAAVLRVVTLILRDLPTNRFGLCSGMPSKGDKAPAEALTVWLADYVDKLSGQQALFEGKKPLTFGDLKKHGIDLQMMTTCLTLGRPFRLPFRDDEQVRENNQFLIKESDFEELFPPYVVAWMKEHERSYMKSDTGPFAGVDFSGYLSLPEPDDLPVVVAARMSLSFPILLSAIPLYSFDFRRKPLSNSPQRCWFTDGGVGSNFPIHFFDAPLPTRPTFGLDLGLAENPDSKRVVFPSDNGDARLPYWRQLENGAGFGPIADFLGAIVNVAKDWNHEALSHLPGFRDRIGLINLTDQEGGLNLTMPKPLITKLTEYGREAGQRFVLRFGDPSKWSAKPEKSDLAMNWENHQLIRLRLLLASVPEMLADLGRATAATTGTEHDYGRFFNLPACGPESYRFMGLGKLAPDAGNGFHTNQAGLANWTFEQLLAISARITTTAAASPSVKMQPGINAPKPTPELKPRPRV
jgi:predicted acylesterase/phospholipase RssA